MAYLKTGHIKNMTYFKSKLPMPEGKFGPWGMICPSLY